jgi:phage recombination protein Bet
MSAETSLATIQQSLPSLNIREKVDTIRQTVAKDANDAQLEMFLTLAERYQLDPFLKEIWFSKELGIITGRDGYLKVAQRDPNYDGIVSAAVCEGDVFKMNPVVPEVQHEFGSKRGAVIGGYAVVFHKKRRPVVAYASFTEYQKPANIWQKYKSAMICKVAEALALKRQFGISGLVTEEEVAPVSSAPPPAPAVVQPLVVHEALAENTHPLEPGTPAEVQEMYRIMAAEKAQGFAKVFALLQDQMISILGQTRGIEAYNLVLGHHGVDTWQSFKSLQKAKQCVLSLHNKITELQSDIEPSGELFAEELATA